MSINKGTIDIPQYILEYVNTYVERGGLENTRLADEANMLFEIQKSDLDRRLNAMNMGPVEMEEEIRKSYITAGAWDEYKKKGYFLALKNENPFVKSLFYDLVKRNYALYSAYSWHKKDFEEGNYNNLALAIEKMFDKVKKGYAGFLNIKYLRRLGGDIVQAEKLGNEETEAQLPTVKLRWKASPAIFGSIIDELISKGYIERPTSSFIKDVNFYLQIFNIDSTPATLAKELSDRTNSLCADNRAKLTLPKIEQLK